MSWFQEKVTNPFFEKRPKQFRIGGALPPKKDLSRYTAWPKSDPPAEAEDSILKLRLKVPPALNQFTKTLYKNLATSLFKILLKYRPGDKAAKKEPLLKKAQYEAIEEANCCKYGLNHLTYPEQGDIGGDSHDVWTNK